ncbi:hypothetical protein AVEN_94807-1 [Araneus ventricosus]|uniref:Uncharacterized protein n=1 Tax=Araneus ventricosus TaxID=182803 RepID=A0A4Y2CMF3_ARAVE|nr:hypothetical protein AVEN_94807-1 [Araneus ventricosus]
MRNKSICVSDLIRILGSGSAAELESVSPNPRRESHPSQKEGGSNEIADALTKAGADDASAPSVPLTYLELFSRAKSRNKTIWLIPPEHHWYQGSRPDQLTAKQLVIVSLVGISEV